MRSFRSDRRRSASRTQDRPPFPARPLTRMSIAVFDPYGDLLAENTGSRLLKALSPVFLARKLGCWPANGHTPIIHGWPEALSGDSSATCAAITWVSSGVGTRQSLVRTSRARRASDSTSVRTGEVCQKLRSRRYGRNKQMISRSSARHV